MDAFRRRRLLFPVARLAIVLLAVASRTELAFAQAYEVVYTVPPYTGPWYPVAVSATPDGGFYLATWRGGEHGRGAIVKVSPTGESVVLYSFEAPLPYSITTARNGDAYGILSSGSLYRITPGGHFFELALDGTVDPDGRKLAEGPDGAIYGPINNGTTYPAGAIFKYSPPNGSLTYLPLSGAAGTPRHPVGISAATDGYLYGTSLSGGSSGNGTLFRFDTTSGTIAVLYSFDTTLGRPTTPPVRMPDGSFYWGFSTVLNFGLYRLEPGGNLTILPTDGIVQSLVAADDGTLYGTTTGVFRVAPSGTVEVLGPRWSETTVKLANFDEVTRGADGRAYAVGRSGGSRGAGSLVRVEGDELRELVSFHEGEEGRPLRLTEAPDGMLYGIAEGGAYGSGLVFSLSRDSEYRVLYAFTGGADGHVEPASDAPTGRLVMGADGHLYGVTTMGGSGYGTVFRLTRSGQLTVLNAFFESAGGRHPAGLVEGGDGNFYGVTRSGGLFNFGTVFRMTPAGGMTVIHHFTGGTGCSYPQAPPVLGIDGSIYGTTQEVWSGCVFRVTTGGMLVFTRNINVSDGDYSAGSLSELVRGADGQIYGAVERGHKGGPQSFVYRLTPAGDVVPVHTWAFRDEPRVPYGRRLAAAPNGDLYGLAFPTPTDQWELDTDMLYSVSPSGPYLTLGVVPLFRDALVSADGYLYAGAPWWRGTSVIFRVPFPYTNHCSFELSPGAATFHAAGGAGSVTVTTASGCAWTSGTDVPWIVLRAGRGEGTGSLGFDVLANRTSSPRTGYVFVRGHALKVTQAAGLNLTIEPSAPAPQIPGVPLTFTAIPEIRGSYEFKWWVLDGFWRLMRDWSADATFSWMPDRPGDYRIGVWVRTPGGIDAPDGVASIAYRIQGVTQVTISPNLPAPQRPGTKIVFTASATGGGAPVEYKWWWFDGTSWASLSGWSATASVEWTATVENTGYRVGVWARSHGVTRDAGEAVASIAYPMEGSNVSPLVSNVTLESPIGTDPVSSGSLITFRAVPQGGVAPYQYRWWTKSADGPWTPVDSTWSSAGTYQVIPVVTGDYAVGVWVRSAGSVSVQPEAVASVSYRVGPALPVSFVEISPAGQTIPVGAPASFHATARNGVWPLSYRWWLFDGQSWAVLSDWSLSDTVTWTPTASGSAFRIGVWVRSSGIGTNAAEAVASVSVPVGF